VNYRRRSSSLSSPGGHCGPRRGGPPSPARLRKKPPLTGSSADEPLPPNAYGADDDRNAGWRSSSTSGACIEPLDLPPITEPGFELIANLNPDGRLGRAAAIPEHLGAREPELERGLPRLREGEHEVIGGVGMGRGEHIPPAGVHQRDL
jgi:hypothetical protein